MAVEKSAMAVEKSARRIFRALFVVATFSLASCQHEGDSRGVAERSAGLAANDRDASAVRLAAHRAELLIDSPRNAVSRLHGWPLQQALDKSCSADDADSASGQSDVVEALGKLSADAVLRSGPSFFVDLTPGRDASFVVAKIIRALHCLCERAAMKSSEALARDGLESAGVMVRLLTSSDDSSTYSLARSAAKQGFACKRILKSATDAWQPTMDTPRNFLQRERLNALSEMITQCQRHQAHDLDAALQVVESGLSALEHGGAAPPLVARPNWWHRLLSTGQANREASGRHVASIIVQSSAEHFSTVVATHDAMVTMLREQR